MTQEHRNCDTQVMTARVGSLRGETAERQQRMQQIGRSGRNQWPEMRNTHLQRHCLPEHLPVPTPRLSPAGWMFTIPLCKEMVTNGLSLPLPRSLWISNNYGWPVTMLFKVPEVCVILFKASGAVQVTNKCLNSVNSVVL